MARTFRHRIISFNVLFPLLEEGGVYIIEDVETSYWTRGEIYGYLTRYGHKHPASIVEIFKDAADAVNVHITGTRPSLVQHIEDIRSVTFAYNCIVVVKHTKQGKERPPYHHNANVGDKELSLSAGRSQSGQLRKEIATDSSGNAATVAASADIPCNFSGEVKLAVSNFMRKPPKVIFHVLQPISIGHMTVAAAAATDSMLKQKKTGAASASGAL